MNPSIAVGGHALRSAIVLLTTPFNIVHCTMNFKVGF